jgi:hypothetical protein
MSKSTAELIKSSGKRKNPPIIEYVPPAKPPGQPSDELSTKIKLLQEQKEINDRILDLLLPTSAEIAMLKQRLSKIKLELQAINLEIQMMKIREQQEKLVNK